VKIFVGARHAVPAWGKRVLKYYQIIQKQDIFSFLVKRLDIGVLPKRHDMPCPYKFRFRPMPIPYIIVCEKFMQFLSY
jgi:hypothetical protein